MPKISSLPTANTPTSSDVLAGVQNGVTKKFSLAIVADFLKSLFVPKTNIGVADGVASLDSNGKVPGTQLDLSNTQNKITASGILKGDGQGGVSAATAGTDYQEPLTAGTDYATPAQLEGKANQAQLAYAETGTTASRAYAVGEYFCWNGLLYRVKTAISRGASFTPGTNCVSTTVGAEIFGLFFRGWFPNGQSMLSVAPGIYRTSSNNLPVETVGVNPYGSLFIAPLGYSFIMYINVDGAVSIWANNQQKWYGVTTTVIN